MKIKELIRLWNTLDKITSMNDSFPAMWDAKMANNFNVLAPVVKQLQERGKKEQVEIAEKEINLPLVKILLEDLPDNVPVGAVSALETILADFESKEYNLNLDDLLNESESEREVQSKD